MTPTEQDKKLEVALMELFCRSEEFGRVFLTHVSKEEFADAVNGGALDHQQAAHEAMQLITANYTPNSEVDKAKWQARADEYNLLSSYLTRSDKEVMDRPTLDLFIARGEELKRQANE